MQWPRLTRQLYLYWRYEREALARAAVNVYASELDANFYRKLFPRRRCAFVPNGVDLDFFQGPPNDLNGGGYIVFEGNIHSWRQIFMDGRKHPEDPELAWYGNSIGRWDGQTWRQVPSWST
jgi:glycosyltransferase involved in cell wall biosynthesis